MIVLGVSTSSARGTVAVAQDGAILARVAYDGGTSHAERLFAAIDAALASAGVTRAALGAVACDVGPGSFTGVRVGVSACQGIALGLGLPAVGIGSLEAMACAARDEGIDRPVLALLDAKKGEVFAATYAASGEALWGPLHAARERADEVAAEAAGVSAEAVVVGVIAESLRCFAAPRRGDALDLPDAAAVAREACARLAASQDLAPFDAARLEPLYVRAPDAKPTAEALAGERPV